MLMVLVLFRVVDCGGGWFWEVGCCGVGGGNDAVGVVVVGGGC